MAKTKTTTTQIRMETVKDATNGVRREVRNVSEILDSMARSPRTREARFDLREAARKSLVRAALMLAEADRLDKGDDASNPEDDD